MCDSNMETPFLSLPSNILGTETETEKKTQTPKQTRCKHTGCTKKLLLSDMECKCGNRYCIAHRFYETHACTYNYRASADETLKKQLVRCVGERLVEKI